MDNLLSQKQFEEYLSLVGSEQDNGHEDGALRAAYAAALTEIEQLRKAQRWIPVNSGRVPPQGTGLLVHIREQNSEFTAYRRGREWYYFGNLGYEATIPFEKTITHWRYLPAPPTDNETTS